MNFSAPLPIKMGLLSVITWLLDGNKSILFAKLAVCLISCVCVSREKKYHINMCSYLSWDLGWKENIKVPTNRLACSLLSLLCWSLSCCWTLHINRNQSVTSSERLVMEHSSAPWQVLGWHNMKRMCCIWACPIVLELSSPALPELEAVLRPLQQVTVTQLSHPSTELKYVYVAAVLAGQHNCWYKYIIYIIQLELWLFIHLVSACKNAADAAKGTAFTCCMLEGCDKTL